MFEQKKKKRKKKAKINRFLCAVLSISIKQRRREGPLLRCWSFSSIKTKSYHQIWPFYSLFFNIEIIFLLQNFANSNGIGSFNRPPAMAISTKQYKCACACVCTKYILAWLYNCGYRKTRDCTVNEMFFCLHIKFMIVMAIAVVHVGHGTRCESKYLLYIAHTRTQILNGYKKNCHAPCGGKYTKAHTLHRRIAQFIVQKM